MQINQQDITQSQFSVSQSPFTCIKCKQGSMVPAIEEGEPEYTEHYLCPKCGFHDTIPTLAIIASQMFTALVGIGVCLYLMLDRAALMGQSETMGTLQVLSNILLLVISVLFVAGFVYVLYQSLKGMFHRRAYTGSQHGSGAAPLGHS